jgi:retron-type reverse transcriptase
MKRIGDLYDRIHEWDNLRAAFHGARKGARHGRAAAFFEARLDENLRGLQAELADGAVQFHGYTRFVIHDPKERTITAPAFRDRVLHHAIMNVCEPHFEKWHIHDTYACRHGKGRLAALERTTAYARDHGWFLKLDVRKYFESIPHDTLAESLGRKFKDRRLLTLLDCIIRSHEASPGRGLPIGSLISQHLANFYLAPVDRLAREKLRHPGYVRYMDDFALWSDQREDLRRAWSEIEMFLHDRLDLELKKGTHLNRTDHGMNFCGFRVFRGWRVLNRRSRRRFALKIAELESVENEAERQRRGEAILAFAREGSSWQFRTRALARATTA